MGPHAAALPQVDFAPTPDGTAEVCRVTAPPSPLPVYLKPAKGRDGAALWVRVGNSTRRLEVDDAVDYVMLRWPRINHVAWPIRLGNFLLRRDQSRRALPINPAAAAQPAGWSWPGALRGVWANASRHTWTSLPTTSWPIAFQRLSMCSSATCRFTRPQPCFGACCTRPHGQMQSCSCNGKSPGAELALAVQR